MGALGIGCQIRQRRFERASDATGSIGGQRLEQVREGAGCGLGGALAGDLARMDALRQVGHEPLQGGCGHGGPDEAFGNVRIGRTKRMQLGMRLVFLEQQLHLPAQLILGLSSSCPLCGK